MPTEKIMPTASGFLAIRALSLSKEKTKITHIEDGFDFLSVNIRKYNGKYLSKPSKEGVKRFLKDIRDTIKANPTAKTENLIRLLNPKLRGWTNYHRHNCAKKTFNTISYCLFLVIWQWAKRRHPKKGLGRIKHKYFRTSDCQNWIFSTTYTDQNGAKNQIVLYEPACYWHQCLFSG